MRTFLASMVHRFARDDLKSDGDGVEAAIRMHIHTAAASAARMWCVRQQQAVVKPMRGLPKYTT